MRWLALYDVVLPIVILDQGTRDKIDESDDVNDLHQ